MNKLIENIQDKAFNRSYYKGLAIHDESIRGLLFDEMISNPKIMVYYHCFYVLDDASKEVPLLFKSYWNSSVKLLQHSNAYHRDFGLTLIANLCAVIDDACFEGVKETYLSLLNDEKFMTSQCCLRNLSRIMSFKSNYINEITMVLLQLKTNHKEKQFALMKGEIIEVVMTHYDHIIDKSAVHSFVEEAKESISPKTRKIAKNFEKRFI